MKGLANEEISEITFDVKATLNTKISAGSSKVANFTLQQGEQNNHSILFDIVSMEQVQKLNGVVSYKVNGSIDNILTCFQVGSNSASKDFVLVLPSSSFIIPNKLEVEQFITLVKTGGLAHASCDVQPEGDFRSFVIQLATLLHVDLVTMDAATATLYGQSIQVNSCFRLIILTSILRIIMLLCM